MKFTDFEQVMSPIRMRRYWLSTGGNTKKAMTLYRFNLRLSQQFFTIISCFEVALRNAIDGHCVHHLGNDWLKNAAMLGGIFDNRPCRLTCTNINEVVNKLNGCIPDFRFIATAYSFRLFSDLLFFLSKKVSKKGHRRRLHLPTLVGTEGSLIWL